MAKMDREVFHNLSLRRLAAVVMSALVLLLLAGLLTFGLVGCAAQDEGSGVTSEDETNSTAEEADTVSTASVVTGTDGDGALSPAAEVARVLGPSVVYIEAKVTQSVPDYYYVPGQQEYTYTWTGSGVIYSSDGKILTNNHVVTGESTDPADELTVTLATGETFEATVVGTDPVTDLAVIQIDAGMSLPAATFVTDLPVLGEYVVALGSPNGSQNSVNLGIVSGLDREVPVSSGNNVIVVTGAIQTDAAISSGSSGGPLANTNGQVVGINFAVAAGEGSNVVENIGYAIPAALVVNVADEIIATGKATHAYLGVSTRTVDEYLQQQFDLSRASGLLVAYLESRGPAEDAGIQVGDIIVKVDDAEMVDFTDLVVSLLDKKPGDTVEVTVDRNGKTEVISVTLEERPAGY